MPNEVGETLKRLREGRGLSQKRLAEMSGVDRSYISQLETRTRQGRISMETAVALARALDVSTDVLFGAGTVELPVAKGRPLTSLMREMREHIDSLQVAEIPLQGAISAGNPFPVEEHEEGVIKVLREDLSGVKDLDRLFALRVSGNSLVGDGIHDGDALVVDPAPVYVEGKIYIVRLGSELAARHVYRDNEHARLVSSDGLSKEITTPELEIVGRVVLSVKSQKH